MRYSIYQKIQLKLIYLSAQKMGLQYIGGHFIKTSIIPVQAVVVDIGGNKGVFTTSMVKAFSSRVYCIEANTALYESLPSHNNITNIHAAITNTNGDIAFIVSENDEASSLNSTIANVWKVSKQIVVPGKTLDTIVQEHAIKKIDILKIDIEGAELNVLDSVSDSFLQSVPQITMEFHEFLDASLSIPTYKAIKRVQQLGFYTIVTSTKKYAEVLFINKKDVQWTLMEKIWYFIHSIVRYKH